MHGLCRHFQTHKKMTSHQTKKQLQDTFQKCLDEADEKDITILKKWYNVQKQSHFFGLNEKKLKKAVSDLRGLTIGRHMRKNR